MTFTPELQRKLDDHAAAKARGDRAAVERIGNDIIATCGPRSRTDAAGAAMRFDAGATPPKERDRLDEAIAAVTDDAALLKAAVIARQCADGAHGGPDAANALRSELRGMLGAGNTAQLRARALTVLELHGCRFDGTSTPVRRADAGASSYSYVANADGSTAAVPWPLGFDEQSARSRLRRGGAPVDTMDVFQIRASLGKLLNLPADSDGAPKQYVGFSVDGDPFAK